MCHQLVPFSSPPPFVGTTTRANLVAPVTTRAGTKRLRTQEPLEASTADVDTSAAVPTTVLPHQQGGIDLEVSLATVAEPSSQDIGT